MIAVIRTLVAVGAMLLFGVWAPVAVHAATAIPTLTGPVVDVAGVLPDADREKLETLSRTARAELSGQGVQLQYVVVPSLDGEPIEDFSIRVAQAWKIGTHGKDNGVLIVVARDDHKVRIEVGGGLEGALTDAQAGRIIRQTIAPAFRAGRYGDGLYEAGVQVLGALGGLPHGIAAPALDEPRPQAHSGHVGAILGIVLLVAFLIALSRRGGGGGGGGGWVAPLVFGGLLGSRRGGGGWSSGGGGGWGGGGGGWGGGGGGFSGGGASGGW